MKRNTITIIELVIVLCVIVVAVRVWSYRKPENKPSLSTPVLTATPTNAMQVSMICKYYNIWEKQVGEEKAKQMVVDWLNNKKLPSDPPVPESLVKAEIDTIGRIVLQFKQGEQVLLEFDEASASGASTGVTGITGQ
ncbi:MAG: hypothetical protein ABRQ38_05000 [Candidatus Eremiobacterota bacterium]